jgi:hypothetical protein
MRTGLCRFVFPFGWVPLEILTSKKLMTGAHAAGKDAACHAQRLAFGLGRLKNLRAKPAKPGTMIIRRPPRMWRSANRLMDCANKSQPRKRIRNFIERSHNPHQGARWTCFSNVNQ